LVSFDLQCMRQPIECAPRLRMKAAVYRQYGSPEQVRIEEVSTPTPGDHEVLIQTRATTVTSADSRVRSLNLPQGFGWLGRPVFGVLKPRQPILGSELAGNVVAIGRKVRKFKPGDAVFGFSGIQMGCHAQYKCLHEDGALAFKPTGLSYEQAAALSFGGTTALTFLNRAGLRAGQSVLVVGASGCVGSAAVQLARHMGAHVTGVCSTVNMALVRQLGAHHVIDYLQEDLRARTETYDLIIDTVGQSGWHHYQHLLKRNAHLALIAATLPDLLRGAWASITRRHIVLTGPAPERAQDLQTLAELAQAGYFKPLIDRMYHLADISQAHHCADSGRKRGSVVVTVDDKAMPQIFF
jgi:NADPH:quinone reductase-like Zn-dependent oxidoreductase